MYSVIDHIEYLLSEHNSVIVPGFGIFSMQYKEAFFPIAGDNINAPHKIILFDQSVNYNDGILVRSIARLNDIDHIKALKTIEDFVLELNISLFQNHENVKLGHVGILKADGNNILFESNHDHPYSFYSFALHDIQMRQLPESNSLSSGQIIKKSENKSDVVHISISKRFIKRISIAASLIIGLLLISKPTDSTNTHIDYADILHSDILSSKIINNPAADTVIVNECDLADLKENSDSEQNPELLLNEDLRSKDGANKITTGTSKRYSIIIASLPNMEAAQKQLSFFEKSGIKNLDIIDGHKVRLSVGTYSTIQEAYNAMNKLKENDQFSDAWIFVEN